MPRYYDRVLHYLATRRARQEAEARAALAARDDVAGGWPEGPTMPRAHAFFPTPLDALEHLQKSFELVDRLLQMGRIDESSGMTFEEVRSKAIGSYLLALGCFELGREDVAARPSSYGRLAKMLLAHLTIQPALACDPLFTDAVARLCHLLHDSKDQDLGELGAQVGGVLDRAAARACWHTYAGRAPTERVSFESPATRVRRRMLHENEVTYEELFGAYGELVEEGVFSCLVEEVLKDGVLTDEEWVSMKSFGALLGLDDATQRRLLREAEPAVVFVDGEPSDTDARDFVARLVEIARADGEVTSAEDRLLRKVAEYLCLTEDELREIREGPPEDLEEILYIG